MTFRTFILLLVIWFWSGFGLVLIWLLYARVGSGIQT